MCAFIGIVICVVAWGRGLHNRSFKIPSHTKMHALLYIFLSFQYIYFIEMNTWMSILNAATTPPACIYASAGLHVHRHVWLSIAIYVLQIIIFHPNTFVTCTFGPLIFTLKLFYRATPTFHIRMCSYSYVRIYSYVISCITCVYNIGIRLNYTS